MITGFFLNIAASIISGLAGYLPTADQLPADAFQWLTYVHQAISLFGWIFPFDTAGQIIAIILVLEAGWLAFKLLVFLYQRVFK